MSSTKLVPHPFQENDLFEGRKLHDLANDFFRKKMSLKTPLGGSAGDPIPKSKPVQAILKSVDFEKEKDLQQLVADLQATSIETLWPGFMSQPPNHIGILHHCIC